MAGPVEGAEAARRLIDGARTVMALTGAGISAESGVPTFRGSEGLWKTFRPEDLATPEAFERDPRLVWEWYGWRREKVARCAPNAAHRALARFALRRGNLVVVTQNVDGLHAAAAREEAGEAPADRALPVELHGNIFRVRCTACGTAREDRGRVDASRSETLPTCAACGALARPDVVWFGESLDPEILERAFAVAREASVALVVGTSGVVQPAASLALLTVRHGGAVIEVNPERTPLTAHAAVHLASGAVAAVPRILGEE